MGINLPLTKGFTKYKDKWIVIDMVDWFILDTIIKNKDLGTVQLSKKVEMKPKNLIERLKKHESRGWIIKKTVPVKPKGRKRTFKVTDSGKQIMKVIIDFYEKQEEINKVSLKAKRLRKLKKFA